MGYFLLETQNDMKGHSTLQNIGGIELNCQS